MAIVDRNHVSVLVIEKTSGAAVVVQLPKILFIGTKNVFIMAIKFAKISPENEVDFHFLR